jgi:hypothetical protein
MIWSGRPRSARDDAGVWSSPAIRPTPPACPACPPSVGPRGRSPIAPRPGGGRRPPDRPPPPSSAGRPRVAGGVPDHPGDLRRRRVVAPLEGPPAHARDILQPGALRARPLGHRDRHHRIRPAARPHHRGRRRQAAIRIHRPPLPVLRPARGADPGGRHGRPRRRLGPGLRGPALRRRGPRPGPIPGPVRPRRLRPPPVHPAVPLQRVRASRGGLPVVTAIDRRRRGRSIAGTGRATWRPRPGTTSGPTGS